MAVGDLTFAFDPSKGETPQSVARKRRMAEAMMGNMSAPRNIGEGMNAIAQAIIARKMAAGADTGEAAGSAGASKIFDSLFSANRFPEAPAAPGMQQQAANSPAPPSSDNGPVADGMDPSGLRDGIVQTAQALGVDPVDLATTISYETGGTFDPMQKGPKTQWGQHKGLIQFGEPQALENGVDWNNPVGSQLGPDGAIAKYLRKAGVQPGMGLMDIYSAINAGHVGRNNASDANNGGAPGTVADKVNNQMAGHRQKALALIGALPQAPAAAATEAMAGGAPIPQQVASLDPSVGLPEAAPVPVPQPQQAMPAPMPPMPQEAAMQPPTGPPQQPSGGYEPGAPAASSPQAQRVLQALMSKQSMTGGAPMPMQGPMGGMVPPQAAAPPLPQDIAPQQKIAQAMSPEDLSNLSPMAGGTAGVIPPGQQQGPSMQQLLEAAGNPWVMERYGPIVNALLQQQMQQSDPMRQLQMQKARIDLEQAQHPAKKFDFMAGKDGAIFRTDNQGNMEQVYGGKPDQFHTLSPDEEVKLGLDPAGAYQMGADNKISKIGGDGTTVNIDQKSEGAFEKKLAENAATMFTTMATEGMTAKADLGVIGELGTLLQGTGGTLTGVSGMLSKYGIGDEGISDIQAAEALINKLVPTQREPGSGSMSDRDVEMFKKSLPSLWNTPNGNQRILGIMQGLAQYKAAQGDIAARVMNGELDRQSAAKELRALPNPLANSGQPLPAETKKPKVIDGYTIEEVP